jgi:hypothetical protein
MLLIDYGSPVTIMDKVILSNRMKNSGQQIYPKAIQDHYSQWCELESVKFNRSTMLDNPKPQLHRIFIDGIRNALKIAIARYLV